MSNAISLMDMKLESHEDKQPHSDSILQQIQELQEDEANRIENLITIRDLQRVSECDEQNIDYRNHRNIFACIDSKLVTSSYGNGTQESEQIDLVQKINDNENTYKSLVPSLRQQESTPTDDYDQNLEPSYDY